MSAGLVYIRQLNLRRRPGLIYEEEEPDRMFEGFKLSEGLAAESAVTGASGRAPALATVIRERRNV